MIYFKHADLSDKYHVSLKTVHNWIDGAKQGKVNLKLHSVTNRTYVANTPENLLILNDLADKGKKYRNTLHHKIIHPRDEFYEILSRRQVLDIITNLDVHREIPNQYNYLNSGADNWDQWTKRLADESTTTNILKGTEELIHTNIQALDRLLDDNAKLNIIDLGVGNGYPVKELTEHFLKRGMLHRYIGVDISPSMLDMAEKNLRTWHGEEFPFEGYVRDFSRERFDDLLVDDMLNDEEDHITNLVLILGDTFNNFRSVSDALRATYSSMMKDDLIIYTTKPDTEMSRRYFDFNSKTNEANRSPNDLHTYVLNMLNIDKSLYALEMGFDKGKMMRYVRVKFLSSITIEFKFDGINRHVNIEKGDSVLLLRIRHLTATHVISEFEELGFTLLQSTLTKDRQFLLSISGVDIRQ